MFNAGAEWREALAAPGIAALAATVPALHEVLRERVAAGDKSEVVVAELVVRSRNDAITTGLSPAYAVAERALASALLQAAAGQISVEGGAAVSNFVGELAAQYANHVLDREAGRVVASQRDMTLASFRALSERVSRTAAELARESASNAPADPEQIRGRWRSLVEGAFVRGRELPGSAR